MSRKRSWIKTITSLVLLTLGSIVVYYVLHEDDAGVPIEQESEHPSDYLPRVTIHVGTSTLRAEVAQSPIEFIRGLSGRPALEEDAGMFFVFPRLGKHGIWMKEMHFPIDIIWLDEYLRVVTVAHDVHPDTFPESFYPDLPSRYVLEVNAGYASAHGIEAGTQLSIQE